MSFSTPAEFLQLYDARTVGDLVQDLGLNVSPAALLTDPNLQRALDGASGELVAACVPNQRYSTADLTTIANSGTPSSFLLKDLEGALALPRLLGRRFYNDEEAKKRIPDYIWSQEYLEKLKNGIRVFELPISNVRAGVMSTAALGSGIVLVGHNRRCFGNTPVNNNDSC
jgi:hypothetical protein